MLGSDVPALLFARHEQSEHDPAETSALRGYYEYYCHYQ